MGKTRENRQMNGKENIFVWKMSYIALNIQKQTNTKKISKFTNTDKAHWLTLTHVPISHGANINRIRKIYRGLLKNAQMNGKHTTHVEYPIKCWKSNNSAKQIVIFSTVFVWASSVVQQIFFHPQCSWTHRNGCWMHCFIYTVVFHSPHWRIATNNRSMYTRVCVCVCCANMLDESQREKKAYDLKYIHAHTHESMHLLGLEGNSSGARKNT